MFMVSKFLLTTLAAGVCIFPLAGTAAFSSMALRGQSTASLEKTAAEVVRSGDWLEWSAWLDKQLTAEFGSTMFSTEPSKIARFLSQPQNALALSQWRLLTATGPENFHRVADKDGSAFLIWLLGNQQALDAYLGSGPLDQEKSARGLEIWRDIFNADTASRDGLWMRVAAATALAHTVPVKSLADGGDIDPLKRYLHFSSARASNQLAPSFDQLDTWELRFVVNSWARDEELSWVLGAIDPKFKSQQTIGDACHSMVAYRSENSKGVSVHAGAAYYDHKPVTMELMHQVGGVCGAISKFGTATAQAFGVPAMPVGQPGHCAFLWENQPGHWRTGNDIFGWSESSQHGGIYIHWGTRGSYVLLMEAAHRDPARFVASERARWAAALAGPNSTALLQAAVAFQPLNGGAWQSLIRELGSRESTSRETWQAVARDLMRALPEHPLPLIDLLDPLEAHLGLTDASLRGKYLRGVCLAIAGVSADAQQGCGQAALEEIVRRQAAALLPGGGKAFDALLAEDSSAPAEQRALVLNLVEIAMKAVHNRGDLENALTSRYLGLMSANPQSLARAIQFFGTLFETAKTNGDRKPALALGRKIILLAAKADDLAAMEKYSAECRKLLD